jgi:secondary thiamine-phosphate synthase enzyme
MTVDGRLRRAPRDVDPNVVAPVPDAVSVATYRRVGVAVDYQESIAVQTSGVAPSFFDCTEVVRDVVRRSGVQQGQLLVATAHTTCSLIVQENEPLLLADLCDRLRGFASPTECYRHNDMDVRTVNVSTPDERANGHSHCQHAMLGIGVTLPIRDEDVVLGRYQRLLLVELDHPRPRELTVQVTGVAPLTEDAAGLSTAAAFLDGSALNTSSSS